MKTLKDVINRMLKTKDVFSYEGNMSTFYSFSPDFTIISYLNHDELYFRCPICHDEAIRIVFCGDEVINCNMESINPEFASVCEKCFNGITKLPSEPYLEEIYKKLGWS